MRLRVLRRMLLGFRVYAPNKPNTERPIGGGHTAADQVL